jgi:tRNA dimethylallyltransferase
MEERRRCPILPSRSFSQALAHTHPRRQILNARKICEICSEPGKPLSIAATEWKLHASSRSHRRRLRNMDGTYERLMEQQLAMREAKRAEREAARAAKPSTAEEAS